MTGQEIESRASQELSKRIDLALYGIGLKPWESRSSPAAVSVSQFYFDENEAAHRAVLLREHLPAEADAIIQEADEICRHDFRLLGYDKLKFGPDIDWHSDPVHGKRSLLKPWFKIRFLEFQQVGDHKIIWELNRHQHLVTLAKAWRLTGRRVYTDELVAQWYSWRKANPYPLGINWASALEAAFRSLSWLWLRSLLAGCNDLPATFGTDLVTGLQSHGRYIQRYLSTYFSPNTHLLGEAVALFFLGTMCPELRAAEEWRSEGWRILLEQSQRQVRPDGVYFEQALYYHVYALDFFLHARQLAQRNGCPIPEQFDNVIKRMLDVLGALSQGGPIESFGDDDGGRVFNPSRNRAEHLAGPLAIGSILYNCNNYPAATLSEEAIWMFGDQAVEFFAQPRPQTRAASQAFPSGGLYLIQDDEPVLQQMAIDAGPQGTGHAGHGHADALSIRFSASGRRVLVDPGTFCYISDTDDRDLFRGTAAHNTLRVDGVDQAVPDGPFAWSSIPEVKAENWVNGRTFDYFVGSHDGYGRLPNAVVHQRSVFHVKGGIWIVRDVAEGAGTHLLETFWHFAPELQVKEEQGALIIGPSVTHNSSEPVRLALLFDHNSGWKTEITEGFVSPVYGLKQPAPLVRTSIHAAVPQESAVMLLTLRGECSVGTFVAIHDDTVRGLRYYRYQTPHSTEFLFFSRERTPWTAGPWSSDANLLYCKLQAGQFDHAIMVSGSFAEWNGRRFFSRPSLVEICEWCDRLGVSPDSHAEPKSLRDVLASDFNPVP